MTYDAGGADVRYMLIHCVDESAVGHGALDADIENSLALWVTEMTGRGVLLDGDRLLPTSEAASIRRRGGQLLVTDGPFAETKEQVAGYDLIECADLDEAIEIASKHPTARLGTIELRPVVAP